MEEKKFIGNVNEIITLKDIVYLILYFLIFEFVTIIPLMIIMEMGFLTLTDVIFISSSIRFVVLLILGIIWYKDYLIRDFSYFKENKKVFLFKIIGFLVCGFLLSILVNVVVNLPEAENQMLVEEMFEKYPFVEFISIAFVAPFIEEIIFRHILIGKVSKVIGIKFAGILSCIFFAFIHSYFSLSIIFYLPISIFITLTYIKNNNNLSSSILFHVLWNSMGLLLMIFGN